MKHVIKRQDFASPLIQNLSITSFLLTKVLTLILIKYIFYRILVKFLIKVLSMVILLLKLENKQIISFL